MLWGASIHLAILRHNNSDLLCGLSVVRNNIILVTLGSALVVDDAGDDKPTQCTHGP